MVEDTSGHEAFAEALSGGGEGQVAGTVDAEALAGQQAAETSQEAAQGGSHGEAAQPAAFDINTLPEDLRKKIQGYDERETWAPPHRLREEAEARRQLESRLAGFEERERRREAEERQRAANQQHETADFDWNNPNQFVDQRIGHLLQQAMAPMQQRFESLSQGMIQETQRRSLSFAQQQHGADKVQAAYQRAMQAAQAGDPTAAALNHSIQSSYDPWGDVMEWDRRRDVFDQTGGNLQTYNERQQETLLKDPAFLARAIEAHRSMATSVQTGVPGRAQPSSQTRGTMPSLNRTTSAADDGAEEDDPSAVFQQALNAPRSRMTG